MKLDINKVNIFERKIVTNNALVFLQFLFLNWSYSPGDFCDMANNIKCFRVDVTLTPGMWASSNIYHIQNSVPNSWFQKGTFGLHSNFL
jgi:hypothetical protein